MNILANKLDVTTWDIENLTQDCADFRNKFKLATLENEKLTQERKNLNNKLNMN